jgi:hypothetical protein
MADPHSSEIGEIRYILHRRPWWRRSLATLTWMPLFVRQRPRWARALWIITTPLWHALRRFGPAKRALQCLSDWLADPTYRIGERKEAE